METYLHWACALSSRPWFWSPGMEAPAPRPSETASSPPSQPQASELAPKAGIVHRPVCPQTCMHFPGKGRMEEGGKKGREQASTVPLLTPCPRGGWACLRAGCQEPVSTRVTAPLACYQPWLYRFAPVLSPSFGLRRSLNNYSEVGQNAFAKPLA